jgi:hypothetical protein
MKTKKILYFLVLALFSVSIFGCASAGVFNEGNLTDVRLAENNYNIVATDVHGESTAAYVLGGTMSNGMMTSIYALFRVSGTDKLYTDAINNLWKNFESKVGPVVGKKYALVNVRYDANCLNLFLYTSVKLTVRADVVEFIDKENKE